MTSEWKPDTLREIVAYQLYAMFGGNQDSQYDFEGNADQIFSALKEAGYSVYETITDEEFEAMKSLVNRGIRASQDQGRE